MAIPSSSAFAGAFLRTSLGLLLLLAGCKPTEVAPNKGADLIPNVHLTLGNPSNATADPTQAHNYLIQRPQYALSYNQARGIPNWVSWQLSVDWLGTAPRQDDFRADTTLPAGWFRATPGSYTGSGFDRGHHCPSADRTRSAEDNSATFLMTNIIPQAPQNNQTTWADLEEYTRSLVQAGQPVYVLMGSYGVGGTGSQGPALTLAAGRITVPARIWKVVVVMPPGTTEAQSLTTATRVIAVDTPNDQAILPEWGFYRTTVDAIEQATGYDLLANVPVAVQRVVEAHVDTGPTR